MQLQPLPDNLKSKTELTRDEISELSFDLKEYSPEKIFAEPDEAFRNAIVLLEYKGVKAKTWRGLNSGVVLAFLLIANNKAFQPIDLDGKIKPLAKEFEGQDEGLTAGEKFELYEKFGEMSLENIKDTDAAYEFMKEHRDLDHIDLDTLPAYAKDVYIANVVMGGYALSKKEMMGLKTS